MSYVAVTKPNQGDGTRLALINSMIDNDAYFNSVISALGGASSPNGSFEFDGNGDGVPDEWAKTLFTGGSFVIDTAAFAHGIKSAKFTSPGGASNGGGYLESSDFFEVSPLRPLAVSLLSKSSVAGILNIVQFRWYDSSRNSISNTNVLSSANNSTSWVTLGGIAYPPSTAYYAKLRLIGADSSNATAGSAWFDDVRIGMPTIIKSSVWATAGTFKWKCPAGVYCARVRCIGGGGGGGGAASGAGAAGGGGGGGAGYGDSFLSVVPGTIYTLVVGANGSGGAVAADGTAGGNSTFAGSTVVGNGGGLGHKGVSFTGGGGGTAGTATGTVAINGVAGIVGQSGGNINGGDGGESGNLASGGMGGTGPNGGTWATVSYPGGSYGGGGGAGAASAAGADGGAGVVIVEII